MPSMDLFGGELRELRIVGSDVRTSVHVPLANWAGLLTQRHRSRFDKHWNRNLSHALAHHLVQARLARVLGSARVFDNIHQFENIGQATSETTLRAGAVR